MQIDVVSDTVCPWCFIGKRRLDRALAMRPDVEAQVFWRPYRLDPSIPKEGVDRKAYIKAKFCVGSHNKKKNKTQHKKKTKKGITFAFDKIAKTPNTLDSH